MENPQVLRSKFDTYPAPRLASRQSSSSSHHVSSSTTTTSIHSSTPPIAMPTGHSGWRDVQSASSLERNGGGPQVDYPGFMKSAMSPIEQASHRRRPSITFDPQVKLDGGRQLPLQTPLPRACRTESYSALTETERRAYESDFGGLGENLSRNSSSSQLASSFSRSSGSVRERRRVTAAHKFLLSPTATVTDGTTDAVASLTSDSTVSPTSEARTPPDPTDEYFGVDLARSPVEDENLSLGSNATWPREGNKITIPRNSSYNFERRKSTRPRSRRASSYNSPTSAGISPASMFLGSFGKSSSRSVEPDSEGQEVGSYVLGKEIGHGGFSTVKEAFTFEADVEIKRAVKIVRKRVHSDDSDNDRVQSCFDHEISLWRYLHHPNIMPLVSVFDTPFATFAFMPFNRDGNLFDLMKRTENRNGLTAQRAQRYSFQLACALRYLHEDMRIVHGDVKLENCLLDLAHNREEGGNLLLCDFGLAKFIQNSHDDDDSRTFETACGRKSDTYSVTGSLQYASPELIDSPTESLSPSVDVWAFAVTVYTLHTGVLPFNHTLHSKLANLIIKGDWNVERLRSCWGLLEVGKTETEKVVQVVKGGLCTNVSRRWSIRDILDSTWFENFGSSSP